MSSELLPLIRVEKKTEAKETAGKNQGEAAGPVSRNQGRREDSPDREGEGGRGAAPLLQGARRRRAHRAASSPSRRRRSRRPPERVSPKLLDAMRFALKRIQEDAGAAPEQAPVLLRGRRLRDPLRRPTARLGGLLHPRREGVVREHGADDGGGGEARGGEEGRALHALPREGRRGAGRSATPSSRRRSCAAWTRSTG